MDVRFVRFSPKNHPLSAPAIRTKEPPALSGSPLISGSRDVADELIKLGIRMDSFDPRVHSSQHQELSVRFNAMFENLASVVIYERPRHSLEIEIARDSGLTIPEDMLELLFCCAAWEIDPPFLTEGRSAWAIPKARLVSSDDFRVSLEAFKLKGIGARDKEMVHPPRDRQFFQGEQMLGKGLGRLQVLVHMGIKDDGSLFPVVDPPKPIGGMKLSRAKAEFDNAKQLMARGVPAVRPIAYGKYSNLTWENESMGFVVLGSTLKDFARIGSYFEPVRDASGNFASFNPLLRSLVERRFDLLRPGHLVYPVMKCVSELAQAIGRALRSFHNAGLCRFAGHTGNFQYDVDKKEADLHDLDSSILIDSLAERARGLSIIRDIESALFGFLHSVLHSEVYRMCNRETPDKCNPFYALLQGYFGSEVSDQVISKTGRIILEWFLDELKTMPRYGSLEMLSWFGMFSMRFTLETMELLMPVFTQSNLGNTYPLPYGPGPIFRNYFEFYQEECFRVGQITATSQFFKP